MYEYIQEFNIHVDMYETGDTLSYVYMYTTIMNKQTATYVYIYTMLPGSGALPP